LINMKRAFSRLPPDQPSMAAMSVADGSFARNADNCAKVLADAHRLVRISRFGPSLNQLLFRACELLDDMDEVLVALHPARNRAEFASAAALHRKLEQIQAAIPGPCRGRVPAPQDGAAGE
jgi:hypothetical protein